VAGFEVPIGGRFWVLINIRTAEIEKSLSSHGIAVKEMFYKPISKPELPELKDFFDLETLQKRIEMMNKKIWVGYEVECVTDKGRISKATLIRNFQCAYADAWTVALNIAEFLVNYELAKLYGIEVHKD